VVVWPNGCLHAFGGIVYGWGSKSRRTRDTSRQRTVVWFVSTYPSARSDWSGPTVPGTGRVRESHAHSGSPQIIRFTPARKCTCACMRKKHQESAIGRGVGSIPPPLQKIPAINCLRRIIGESKPACAKPQYRSGLSHPGQCVCRPDVHKGRTALCRWYHQRERIECRDWTSRRYYRPIRIVAKSSREDVVSSPRRSIALMRLIWSAICFRLSTMCRSVMTKTSGLMVLAPEGRKAGKSMWLPRVPGNREAICPDQCGTGACCASCNGWACHLSCPRTDLAAHAAEPPVEPKPRAGALFASTAPSADQDRSGRIARAVEARPASGSYH
jgi:hypothetical protein